MRNKLIIIILAILLSPLAANAGIYGILKGRVVDQEGKAMIGASVRVLGTTRGTYVKDKNGRFTIVNITSGTYDIRISSVGYANYTTKVTISADNVTEIKVKLTSKDITTEPIVVVADRQMVSKTKIGSGIKIGNKDLTRIAGSGIQALVGRSAGVITDRNGRGFQIRGSRSSETQIRIDGVNVTNQFTGTFIGGIAYTPVTSSYATEEVQVLTGDFSAEYGNAIGGVVNSVIKTGRTDKYEGFVHWYTDIPSLNGSQTDGLEIVKENGILRPVNTGEGHKLLGRELNQVEFQVGGPLPILENSTFNLSAYNYVNKHRNRGYDITDPWGNNTGQLPDQGTWKKNMTGRMRFAFTNDLQLILGGQYGITSYETSSLFWLYANDNGRVDGLDNGIPERVAKQRAWNETFLNVFAKINRTLSSKSFYEFKISFLAKSDQGSKRIGWSDPDFFTGFELQDPIDERQQVGDNLERVYDKNGNIVGDRMLDHFQEIRFLDISADGYFPIDKPQRNPLTGYIEGPFSRGATNNPFGLDNYFYGHGNTSGVSYRFQNTWQIDGSITQVVDVGDFSHTLKAGFESMFHELHRHSNSLPWDAEPFYDIYTDKFGGNIYATNKKVKNKTSSPYRPVQAGIWAQDQINYKGIVITPSFRFDIFDSDLPYRKFSDKFIPITEDAGFASSNTKFYLSPRLNVLYPITERSNFRISYGIYYQIPEFQFMYDSYAKEIARGNVILGNPNIEPQKTNQYGLEYNNQLTDDFAFKTTAYYKDIYNELGIVYFETVPDPFRIWEISEYGNARGIEFEFRKLVVNNFGFRINYGLASVVGTSDEAFSNYNIQRDPFADKMAYPLAPYALSRDIRHNANAIIDFVWGNNEGPSIGGIRVLENTNINFANSFRTGTPYTKTDPGGQPTDERNTERNPSVWNTNLRFTKQFFLSDIFGVSAGNTSVEFYIDVFNLFNLTGPTSYYTATGDPDDDGVFLDRRVGDFTSTNWYKEADYKNGLTIRSDQYDIYGVRKYSEYSDLDKNGIVTQAERYENYISYIEMRLRERARYQRPTTVEFGLFIRF